MGFFDDVPDKCELRSPGCGVKEKGKPESLTQGADECSIGHVGDVFSKAEPIGEAVEHLVVCRHVIGYRHILKTVHNDLSACPLPVNVMTATFGEDEAVGTPRCHPVGSKVKCQFIEPCADIAEGREIVLFEHLEVHGRCPVG